MRPGRSRAAADALLRALEADQPLLRVVTEELPIAGIRDRRRDLERRVRDLVGLYLASRPGLSTRPDPAIAAWVIVNAMENLAVRWVLDAPPYERAWVLDEVVALVTGYLAVPEASPGRR